VHAVVADQLVLQFHGYGGLAGGGQAGQPDCEALLVAQFGALLAGEGAGVEGDVAVVGLVWCRGGMGVGLGSYVDILEELHTVQRRCRKKKDEGQLKRGRVRRKEDPRGSQILAVKYTMAQLYTSGLS
jgi:hypothetical protein